MSDDRMFERDAQAWLEIGPSRAPARAVQKALQIIESTPQQRDLRILWRLPNLTLNKRLAIAAAVGLLVVGAGLLILRNPQSQVGQPSPSPTSSPSASPILLEQLKGTWAAVGARSDPFAINTSSPLHEAMSIDPAAVRISAFRADITSSASLVEPRGLLALQMQTAQETLTGQNWDCRTGDLGTYVANLSADGQTLTLTSQTDSCVTRAAILTGDWTRWVCPAEFAYAYCSHVSELAPGRYTSPLFKPFSRGTSGQLAYSVPAGWADMKIPPTWVSADRPASLDLATLAAPEAPSITVYSTLLPYAAHAVPAGPLLDCSGGLPAPAGPAGRVANWLESLPYLAISQRTPVTIGGLSGVQVDLSMAAGYVDPCSFGTEAGGSIEYSRQIQIFGSSAQDEGIYMDSGADEHARFILLDIFDGQLVIAISASGQAAFDAAIAQAMPVIETFEFIP